MTKKNLFFSMLILTVFMFSNAAFSVAPYPKDKVVENDMKKNWKVQGEQGTLLSVKKEGEWTTKIIVRDRVKMQAAIIRYSAKVDFKTFIRNFNVDVVYIEHNNKWIFDSNVILDSKDEAKEGQGLSRDEAKAIIAAQFEKQPESFLNELSCSAKIKAPVKVEKVLITEPEIKGNWNIYYADIIFTDARGTSFTFENMKVDMRKKNENEWETVLRSVLGKCVKP